MAPTRICSQLSARWYGWRKNATLPQRVETSRRRSRRCLLMSLALAKTSVQQRTVVSVKDAACHGRCFVGNQRDILTELFLISKIGHMLTISESSVKSSSSSLMRHRSYYYKAIVAGRLGSKDSTDTSVSCPDQANPWDTEYEEAASRGLLYQRPMDVDVYLNCHQRKLQILIAAAGIGECLDSCKSLLLKSGSNIRYASGIDTQESSSKQCWNLLVAEEVKAIVFPK
ncbi:hypothetical protein ACFX13_044042 [Malus domestica]